MLYILRDIKCATISVTHVCSTTYDFKEHGSYGWNISEEGICSHIYTIREPINSYLRKSKVFTTASFGFNLLSWCWLMIILSVTAIFAAFMVYVLLTILFATGKVIVRVVKGKLSPDTIRDVSVSVKMYVCYCSIMCTMLDAMHIFRIWMNFTKQRHQIQ